MSNITTILSQAVAEPATFESMASYASTLLWASLELVISIGIIAAYSHVLCFATSLVIRDEQSLGHSNDPDLPKKEQTAALILTAFLSGLHIMLIFFGLPLLGHDSDSFLMKVLFSCAVLAGVTTGVIIGGIVLYLLVPAFASCGSIFTKRTKVVDVEAPAVDLEKQAFLEVAQAKK